MRHPATTRCGGFAYMALMLAVAVMGLVLGVTAEVWHTAVQREKERELLFVGSQFRRAIGAYYLDHARAYPPSLEDLLKDSHQPATRRYLRKIYRDPMTGANEWGLVQRPDGGIVGVHSLSEAQPIKIAGFRGADSSLEGAVKYSEWVFAYWPHTRSAAPKTGTTTSAGKGKVGQ